MVTLRSAYSNKALVGIYGMEGASSRLISTLYYDFTNFAEWIKYSEVFGHHWRKSVLQAIDAILLQRSFTTDTWVEAHLLELRTEAKD
ncbi:hypothetical protein BDV33DRAFT_184784 [Aspergillus novoparasiticus]|uniref:Uncharacterized protein n=1 Tax=Aspergillus novoparasiticus TaxID=986946 RepID=A0A5N6E8L8_9EURO|nr:hypothetical protein BDV33DRAFT_184784 [Aspergillus novoparasiticus]